MAIKGLLHTRPCEKEAKFVQIVNPVMEKLTRCPVEEPGRWHRRPVVCEPSLIWKAPARSLSLLPPSGQFPSSAFSDLLTCSLGQDPVFQKLQQAGRWWAGDGRAPEARTGQNSWPGVSVGGGCGIAQASRCRGWNTCYLPLMNRVTLGIF